MPSAETQLASLFKRYEPAVARLGKALRKKLCARLPGLCEVVYVYERQESLVISYSPTEQGYEGLCTLALYPDCVKLFFAHSPALAKADTNKLLQGSGKKVRFVLLGKPTDVDSPEIEALMEAVIKQAKLRLEPNAKGSVIIKAEAQKKRAARSR